ncbi:MAG: A24 family peptidase [Candidatus Melainabacteria bacterium]
MPAFALLTTTDAMLMLGIMAMIGLCVGSFLNVVGLRFLAEESVVFPASHCPQCNTPLQWLENIPVLSYLIQRGRCKHCACGIHWQYPVVEILTAILFCAVLWQFGISWQTLFWLFFMANVVVITITDLRESLIFNINSLSLVPAGLLYHLLNLAHTPTAAWNLGVMVVHVPEGLTAALIAVGVAFVFFEGLILFSRLALGTDGFGHGDTFLMMGVGAYLGWKLTLLSLALGFIIQTIPSIPIMVWQWIQQKQYVSLISGGVAAAAALSPLALMQLHLERSLETMLMLGCMGVSVIALVVFMRNIRQTESHTYLPLGPALVLGSIIALFWGQAILSHFHWG